MLMLGYILYQAILKLNFLTDKGEQNEKEGYEDYGTTFKHGQIASKETEHAKLIAKELGTDIKEIDISSLNRIFEAELLVKTQQFCRGKILSCYA